jgi:hypothetical protein
MSGDGGVELRHDVLRRHDAFARHVPATLGVAWSSRWMAATPGLLVIARADDVDGIAVTGIKDRAD